MYIGLYKTPNKALSCLVLFPLVPFVTPCHPCYPLLPLLPLVTPCHPCYPLLPLVTLCYTLLPLLPFVTLVTLENNRRVSDMTLKMFSSNRGRRVCRFNTYLSPPILSWLLCTYPIYSISHFFF